MTREQWNERIPIIKAFAEGKRLQIRTFKDWKDCPNPDFSAQCENYRIAPEPKWRPWTLDEVPVGAQVRYKGNRQSVRFLIVGTLPLDKAILGAGSEITTQCLFELKEHSIDGGKTWHPCGVLESQ